MEIVGINEIHADSRNAITEILGNGFDQKVKTAILSTPSAQSMGIKRVIIEKVEILGTRYEDGDPIGVFEVKVKFPVKKYEPSRSVYSVYIAGGKRITGDAAYFQKDEY